MLPTSFHEIKSLSREEQCEELCEDRDVGFHHQCALLFHA